MRNKLMKEIDELNDEFDELREHIASLKADGNLAVYINTLDKLNTDFLDFEDSILDDDGLREKYGDWDYENECVLFEKSNNEILEELDEHDLKLYINSFKAFIEELEEEIK